MVIGTEIRRCRKALGWTQIELARRIGVHNTWIYKVETGQKDPSLKLLRDIGMEFQRAGEPFQGALAEVLGLDALAVG